MVLYPILLIQACSTTVPNFMLVSGIAQSGQNLAISRLAIINQKERKKTWSFSNIPEYQNTLTRASGKSIYLFISVHFYLKSQFTSIAVTDQNTSCIAKMVYVFRSNFDN